MNNLERLLLFWMLCVPIRLLIAYLPIILNKIYMYNFGIIILLISFGFFYLSITNSRLDAYEGGGKTWWASYRILHFVLYFLASMYLLNYNRNASIPLLIDILCGIVLFFLIRNN